MSEAGQVVESTVIICIATLEYQSISGRDVVHLNYNARLIERLDENPVYIFCVTFVEFI